MANTQYPKMMYHVYECVDVNCAFSYDSAAVLLETSDLGAAHNHAYQLWLEDTSKAYTIIQPYTDDCRGGYGEWTVQEDQADLESWDD